MADPTQLPQIGDADAEPARVLFLELRTRIATQPLHYRAGDEETAAKSVYELFPLTRKLLEKHWEAKAFAVAGIFLLNRVLRPNTARWHRWMVDGKFADEQLRRKFRYELQQLRPRLEEFADLFGLFAEQRVEATGIFAKLAEADSQAKRTVELGGRVVAGIASEVPLKQGTLHSSLGSERFATASEIDATERRAIQRRRNALDSRRTVDENAPVENAAGLCLSGGGIRSATFSLGIVQVFVREGLFERFDYLSTVSGGGYLGSFLTTCLGSPPEGEETAETEIRETIQQVFTGEGGRESNAIRHLRNNSRYLISGGLWARLKMFGLIITGILTNILLMLPLSLFAVVAVAILFWLGYWSGWTDVISPIRDTPAFYTFVAFTLVLVAGWFFLPLVRSIARGAARGTRAGKVRRFWETTLILLSLVVFGLGILILVPRLFDRLAELRSKYPLFGATLRGWFNPQSIITMLTAIGPFILGLFAARSKTKTTKKWTTFFFGLSGPFLALVVFLLVGNRSVGPRAIWPIGWVIVVTLALAAWGWLFVDINQFSPHTYYRNRLCECYLAVRQRSRRGVMQRAMRWILHGRKKDETFHTSGIGTPRTLPLSQINRTKAAPYHLVNTAVNLPASLEPNLRGRDCDFFSFSRDYCGGPVCGYIKTRTLERLDPHMDLGTAMAVSGAAASSNMGVKTLRELRFLLTLLNVRLGYWLRNPLSGLRHWWNPPGPLYLFREMTGWMHEKTGYLNLSDGGHIENLALYEMLRRRCKFIVVVDGGMEPGMECADLMLVQRYAQIDLGVQIDLDLADLALGAERRSRAYAVFGKVHYGPRADGTGAGDLGWIVYFKLARTGSEPGYVVDYARQNPEFPHQSTADQIYDEAQFEAYRRLGECAAASLFRPEIAKPYFASRPDLMSEVEESRFNNLDDWFQALAGSLLPDNDPVFDATVEINEADRSKSESASRSVGA